MRITDHNSGGFGFRYSCAWGPPKTFSLTNVPASGTISVVQFLHWICSLSYRSPPTTPKTTGNAESAVPSDIPPEFPP